jgi:hypothetical protein
VRVGGRLEGLSAIGRAALGLRHLKCRPKRRILHTGWEASRPMSDDVIIVGGDATRALTQTADLRFLTLRLGAAQPHQAQVPVIRSCRDGSCLNATLRHSCHFSR